METVIIKLQRKNIFFKLHRSVYKSDCRKFKMMKYQQKKSKICFISKKYDTCHDKDSSIRFFCFSIIYKRFFFYIIF